MNFVCEKGALLREIAVAQEIISSRNVMSILSNVLLEAEDNGLTIKATDLKVGFESKIPVSIVSPGSTTVFCDKFLSILRSLPDGEVEFRQEEDKLLIIPKEKKIDFQLRTISSEKYPELQKISEDRFFQISQKDFIEMVTQTSFAVSDDETRYFMNGVYLENEDGDLLMVATDGRRLSFIRKGFDIQVPEFNPVIIPPKILNLVKKLSSGEGNISFAVSDKSVFIHFDNQKLSSNLIEGQFPNYKRVIPGEQDYELKVERGLFMDALRRVSLLVEQKSRRIYLSLSENTIILHSEESDIGVAKEEIACTYTGPEFNIALNCIYLEEPLRVMEDDLLIKLTEPNKAISIFPDPEKDYFHIVMPMQID